MKGKIKRSKQQQPLREDNSRKLIRKQKRLLKKAHRHQHYAKSKAKVEPHVGRFVKRPAQSEGEDAHTHERKKPKPVPSTQDLANKERQNELKKEKKLHKEMEEQRRKMLLKANEDEDKLIKKLEKQLGMAKIKNKKNLFASDGLDYLLEVCDRSTQEQLVAAQKHLANVDGESDFDDDLAAVTGKTMENSLDSDDVSNDDKFKVKSKKGLKGKSKESMPQGSDDEAVDDLDDDSSNDGVEDASADEIDDTSDDGVDDVDVNSSVDEMDKFNEDADTSESEMRNKGNKTLTKRPTSKPKLKEPKSNVNQKKNKANSKPELNSDNDESDIEDNHAFDDDAFDESDDDKNEEQDEEEPRKVEKPEVWEDIYGRKRDKEGNVIKEEKGTYIPPHLRNKKSSSQSEQLIQLKRQIKGVLNKLAGTNLHWACTSVEALYGNNSRNAVNTALSDLWIDAVVQLAITPDRMLAEHAALVSVLQANVGMEVGAHFLQVLAQKFDEMVSDSTPSESKELENLTAALAFLYSFKIYQASLLYEMLTRLLDDATEQHVSCILAALRAVGGTLRKDQPLALKTFIHDTQTRIAKLTSTAAVGTRIKFLLEVLMAVKNNNLTKIPNYDPTYCEDLKKMSRGIIRKGNYVTTLNIGLEDLLKADTRGKWWVVGSAWEGGDKREQKEPINKVVPTADLKLLELARKQRMNTDIRRSIFCIIMSAQDYMDAFERLQHLGLKNQQEREIVHVMLACCLQEKTYNPYYAVLAQKFCDHDRKYQLSIQYSVWDKIKDLESSSKLQTANLAQFLIHLIMEKGLPLSVLKVIEFADLNKSTVRFMRQILLSIIMNENLQSSLEVFQRISVAPKLHMFRESLRLFIQHFLIRNAGKKTNILSEEEMAILKERTQQVERILSSHDSKLRL